MSEHRMTRSPVYTKADVSEVIDVDERERTIKSKITTDKVDSDQEVVITSGLKLARYEKNPVVLFMHDPFTVVGKSLWQKVGKNAIVAKTRFAETELADDVFKLYAGGFLKGWSVGLDWQSVKRRDLEPTDLKKRPDWAGARTVIESAELIEYSAVSIPANPDALNRAYAKGMFKTARPWIELDIEEEETQNSTRRVAPVKTVIPVRSVRRKVFSVGEISRLVDRNLRLACGRP